MVAEKEKLVYTVEEAGALLDLSRPTAYSMAKRGLIPTIRLGHRLVVPKKQLELMMSGEWKPATESKQS